MNITLSARSGALRNTIEIATKAGLEYIAEECSEAIVRLAEADKMPEREEARRLVLRALRTAREFLESMPRV